MLTVPNTMRLLTVDIVASPLVGAKVGGLGGIKGFVVAVSGGRPAGLLCVDKARLMRATT